MFNYFISIFQNIQLYIIKIKRVFFSVSHCIKLSTTLSGFHTLTPKHWFLLIIKKQVRCRPRFWVFEFWVLSFLQTVCRWSDDDRWLLDELFKGCFNQRNRSVTDAQTFITLPDGHTIGRPKKMRPISAMTTADVLPTVAKIIPFLHKKNVYW